MKEKRNRKRSQVLIGPRIDNSTLEITEAKIAIVSVGEILILGPAILDRELTILLVHTRRRAELRVKRKTIRAH